MTLHTIQVPLGKKSYPIWIDNGLSDQLVEILSPINKGQIFAIICHQKILDIYGKKIAQNLIDNGYNVKILVIEEGETAKSLTNAEMCWNKLIDYGCDRSSILIALGGGVTGDLTGFLASTLFRGIQFVQIPTTLLAMVDSSIGGKTGVNLASGKNLIGTFYQPNSVIIDPTFLESLPKKEIKSGFGEIIKYGAIKDPKILSHVLSWFEDGSIMSDDKIIKMIKMSCKIKADIVAKDELEGGLRRILNFGHTFGHSLEAATAFKYFTHGEAVMHGIRFAIELSVQCLKIPKDRFIDLMNCINLMEIKPLPILSTAKLHRLMFKDKKRIQNKINFILLRDLGKPVISDDIPITKIENQINNYLKDNT